MTPRRRRLRALLSTLASAAVAVAATLARPADLPSSEPAAQGHRDLFREAMRHRDLGRWQEALILFETARKQNGEEGERVRFYGQKRFPHYVPRFYIGEALFKLGDYARAFETWSVYQPGGRYAAAIPDEQRREIAGYRWLYEKRIQPELVQSLAQRMIAARGSLAALSDARQSLGAVRWRDVEARTPSAGLLCPARSAAGADRLQELDSCLDSAELVLSEAGRAFDYARIAEASRLLDALSSTIVAAEGQVGRFGPTAPKASGRSAGAGPTRADSLPPFLPPATTLAPSQFYANRYALVIGVWEYRPPWKRLPGVEIDVKEVSTALRNVGYEVELLPNPTRDALEKTLRRFLQSRGNNPHNQLIVYYAGHGGRAQVVENGIENAFMIPVDARESSDKEPWYYSAVPLLTLVNEIQAIPAEHVLAVLDSCFSGAVFRYSFKQPDGLPAPGLAGVTRGQASAGGPPSTGAARTENAWADTLLRRPARWYLAAGRHDEEVPDRSRFRKAFVDALSGAAPSLHPPVLTIRELSAFVEDQVGGTTHTPIGGQIGIDSANQGQILFQLEPQALRARAAASRFDAWRRVQLAFVPRIDARAF